MERCISLETLIDYEDGEFLGVDELGDPVYDVVVTPVGEYCSHYETHNPNCEKCKAFRTE